MKRLPYTKPKGGAKRLPYTKGRSAPGGIKLPFIKKLGK